MKHTIAISADGSSTLKLTEFDECYHSNNGAYNETMHIYIKNGVEALYNKMVNYTASKNAHITVYDIGLGTALNCILTLLWQQSLTNPPHIRYIGIEKYPISCSEAAKLNYPKYIAEQIANTKEINLKSCIKDIDALFRDIHSSAWEEDVEIAPNFTLHKSCADIVTYELKQRDINLNLIGTNITNCKENSYCKSIIFYDTFSPATQPQLWSKEIFKKFYDFIKKESTLLTYCSKGTVKQALRESGFIVKRLEGPLGKRHIVQATKP